MQRPGHNRIANNTFELVLAADVWYQPGKTTLNSDARNFPLPSDSPS